MKDDSDNGPQSQSDFVPLVAHDDFPEITVRAVILSSLLSIILGSANVYLGLLVGLTVSASIPASVISMALLRLFPNSNILENNIVQTAASAGESLAAGVIFTIPGLVILGRKNEADEPGFEDVFGWNTFLGTNYIYVTLLALLGGLMGIMMSVPIRRALIEEIQPPLKFPEGVATAQVLRAGDEGGQAVWAVVAGAALGAVTKTLTTIRAYEPISGFGWLYKGKYPSYFGINVAASLLAVGYIVGPNVGTVLFIGAVLQYFVAMPISAWANDDYEGEFTAAAVSNYEFPRTRYIGVGIMVVGGIWAIISVRHAIKKAVAFGIKTFKMAAEDAGEAILPRYEQDLPFKVVLLGLAGSLIPLYILFSVFSGEWAYSIVLIIVVAVLAFVFSAVAAYMAGLVGSSNNPISGVTLVSSLVISAVILLLFGKGSSIGPGVAVVCCASICCAAAISGDNLQDLKCGRIVGATPRKQEIIMIVGVAACSFVIAPILEVLEKAYTIGGSAKGSLAAPQASIIATIPVGILNGGLPWNYIITGLVLGVLIIIVDLILEKNQTKFRLYCLGVAIAFYIPIYYTAPIFIGSMVHVVAGTDADKHSSDGILYAAGLVTGDALFGIITAIPIVITTDANVLVPNSWQLPYEPPIWPSFIALAALLFSLFYIGKFEPFTGRASSEGTVAVGPEL